MLGLMRGERDYIPKGLEEILIIDGQEPRGILIGFDVEGV